MLQDRAAVIRERHVTVEAEISDVIHGSGSNDGQTLMIFNLRFSTNKRQEQFPYVAIGLFFERAKILHVAPRHFIFNSVAGMVGRRESEILDMDTLREIDRLRMPMMAAMILSRGDFVLIEGELVQQENISPEEVAWFSLRGNLSSPLGSQIAILLEGPPATAFLKVEFD